MPAFGVFALQCMLFCFALFSATTPWAQDTPIPTLSSPVMDTANLLNTQEKQALQDTLKAFEAQKGAQIVVLTVPSTQPETIEQYSIRVAEAWKIGRANIDDGAILVVAANDRALRIEVGYGLEGALTDLTSKRIIDEIIVPQFRQGQFANGIAAGVDSMMQVINGEPLPAPSPQASTQTSPKGANSSSAIEEFAPLLFIVALGVGNVLRKALGKGPAALLTGGAVGFLAWIFVGALVISIFAAVAASVMVLSGAHTGRGIGAYGSHRGGRGGFGGGGFGGGFGGGGGGFGGGGASGRW